MLFNEKETCQCRMAYVVLAVYIFKAAWSQDKRNRGRCSATRVGLLPEIFANMKNSCGGNTTIDPESTDSDGGITYVKRIFLAMRRVFLREESTCKLGKLGERMGGGREGGLTLIISVAEGRLELTFS